MDETPKKPNMSPPSKPAGQGSTPSQGGFNELTKTMRDIRDMQAADMKDKKDSAAFERKLMVAEQVEQLHMINIMKSVESSIKSNTDTLKAELDKNQKTFTKSLADITENSKEKKESTEEKNEGEEAENKRWKAFGDSIKKGFSIGVDKGKGFFSAIWSMLKKFKTVLLAIGLGTILANISVGDLKKTWIKVKDFFVATKAFLTPIAEWLDEAFFPATLTLFFSTMDNLKILFDNLTKDFEGFMSKGWIGKTESIFMALADIGHFVGSFLGSVLDWTMQLLGYGGSVTKDIKSWMENHFAPDTVSAITTLFTTVAGGFALMTVFGMNPFKFMSNMGKFLFGSIRLLFATIGLALTPIGLGLTLAALTVTFSDEIIRAIENFVGSMRVGFSNIFIDLNNALAATPFGKYILRMKTKENIEDFSEKDEAKKYKANKEKEISALEKSIANQEKWKELSALPDGGGRRTQEMTQQLKHTKEFRPQEEVKLKAQKSLLESEKKGLADFESIWSSQLGQSPSKSPYSIGSSPSTTSDGVNSSMDGSVESSGKLLDKLLGRKTIGHEGYSSTAYPDAGGLSIGHGFHLSKHGAAEVLKKAGINKSISDLMSGKETITKEEAKKLIDVERGFFIGVSKKWIGSDFWDTQLSVDQQAALVDMSYNMGAGFYKEGNWPDLKRAILANDDMGIRKGVLLNKSGTGPSKYSQDVGSSRVNDNITALQNNRHNLSSPYTNGGAGASAPVFITNNNSSSTSNQNLNGRGRSPHSDSKIDVRELASQA